MSEVSFTVDPQSLDSLRGRLDSIESRMTGIGGTIDSYPWQDLATTDDVHNALQSFSSDWSNGLALISHNIQQLTKLLSKASTDYQGTDDQVAQAATPGGVA
jgi:uncharacterized phage infection (PIP) family protein YhgE